jgi:hypothetical protein
MTKGTRYFLAGALLTLVVGVGAGSVAYYSGFPMGFVSRSSGPEELRYVPRDATVLAYADVRDVMNSELRQRLKGFEPQEKKGGREEFQARTGINIETDIDHVVACMTRDDESPSEKSKGNGLVLARGRFDEVRLEGLAKEHGGMVEDYKGKRLVTHAGTGDEELAMAFLEAGLVALGSDRLVRQAIDLAKSGESITANTELMRLVADLDPGNAWAVGRFDTLASEARLPEGVASQIPAITWVSATGRINGGLNGVLKAEARDDAAAQNLRDVIRGFMALAKLQSGSRPELQVLLQSLQLSGTGKTVVMSFSVPAELFDALAKEHERQH